MNKERLLKCAEAVESVPPHQFKMHIWMHENESCGTAGCAVGWYVQKNPGCGLELAGANNGRFYPSCDGFDDMTAVSIHFDIPKHHAEDIFDTLSYPMATVTTTEVVERIRDYVSGDYVPDEWNDDDE